MPPRVCTRTHPPAARAIREAEKRIAALHSLAKSSFLGLDYDGPVAEQGFLLTSPPGIAENQWEGPTIEVIRSTRRRRTAQGSFKGERIVVRVPAGLRSEQEAAHIRSLAERMQRKRRCSAPSDADLQERAEQLNRQFLEGRARAQSVRWVSNQQHRWGSCSQGTGEIRISERLRHVPDYVLNAVLVHELAHTFILDGHSPEFTAWARRAPQWERAEGYLEAYQRWGSQPIDAPRSD